MSLDDSELRRRNKQFAADRGFAGLAFPTASTLRVLTCVDSRVDPAEVLGLKLGEALVMRNVGGRVTPSVLRSWQLLNQLGASDAPATDEGPPHLVVMHHTDCGIKRLADIAPSELADFFEVPVSELPFRAIMDPRASLHLDIATVRDVLRQRMTVSGLLYDVDTGLIDVVIPPAPPTETGT